LAIEAGRVLSPAVTEEGSTPAPPQGAGTVAWTGSTYFAEGLPWSVLHQVASEFFTAAGLPARQVGYTSALHATGSLKFLWSPVVDLFGTLRQWMIATQALLGALMGLLAVLAHELFTAGSQDTTFIWVMLVGIGVASATHDIACDGYYMDALPKQAQARNVGVRVAAFRAAMFVGNSGLVYLAGRTSWLLGFGVAGALMAALAAGHWLWLPRVAGRARPVKASEPAKTWDQRLSHVSEAYLSFFQMKHAALVVGFLLCFKLGDALLFNMSKVMLRDIGVSTAERGAINGYGTAASIAGAILGGMWISRVSLTRALLPITLLMAVTHPLYLIIAGSIVPMQAAVLADAPAYAVAHLAPSHLTIASILVVEQFCGGMATAAQMVFLMSRCHPDHKAAHFAFGTAIYSLAQMITGSLSGHVYELQGPLVYFALTCVACIPCVLLVRFVPTR
jgi:MFS transporter, PAT family, beta-lactamase induction signal transducer AmpG